MNRAAVISSGGRHVAEEPISPDPEYFLFRIMRSKSVSRDSLPGPKIRMIRPTNRKINGAALENLSGSEKNASSDGLSPAQYATNISMTMPRAAIRDSRQRASRIPATNSNDETKVAVKAGACG